MFTIMRSGAVCLPNLTKFSWSSSRFADLEGAEVGRGPRHPEFPDLILAPEIEAFLSKYPFLMRDQGYVDFLECYAGAWVMWPNNDLVIDIFGFTDVSTHIVEQEGTIVDNRGFLTVCDGIARISPGSFSEGVIGQGFAFDSTETRTWGVYRYVSDRGVETAMYWYCDTFLEAVEALIDTKGRLPERLT